MGTVFRVLDTVSSVERALKRMSLDAATNKSLDALSPYPPIPLAIAQGQLDRVLSRSPRER